jgi:cyclopropane fatty-acyl-phospholipid synthase-like methyltransferase
MQTDLITHYRQLLHAHGDTFEAAQYSSRASQEARYAVLTELPGLQGSRVLDFGCGTGHLATYLAQRGIGCHYTGIDIVDDFFPHARAKHPQHRFGQWADFEGERFDHVFVSGVFNNRMPDNLGFFTDTTRRLFERCDVALSFNLMSTHVDYQDPGLWYVAPEEVFSLMKGLTPYISLLNDYVVKDTAVPFEFAVRAWRHPRRPTP